MVSSLQMQRVHPSCKIYFLLFSGRQRRVRVSFLNHLLFKQLQSVQLLSCVQLFAAPWTAAHQASLSPTPRACSDSYPSSWWCHPTISSSVVPFSSCLQSFPASGSFQMSQFFTSGGRSIEVSASASVLPMNIQDWFLGLTGCISLQSNRLSRVFSNTTVQKHQSSALSFLHSPTLTSIHDHWKNHSFH